MLSPEALSAAVEKASAALRALGVEVQHGDERKAQELAAHVLQVYREHNQKISKVLCVVGSDAKSRVLLVLGRALETAGVELQLVATDPALRKKLDAQPALPNRLPGMQLVLAGDVAHSILQKVRSLTEKATVHPGPGFPRALATVQSWAPDAMGKPKDTTLEQVAHFEQVVPAKLEVVHGFVLGKAFEHPDAARLGSAPAHNPAAALPPSASCNSPTASRGTAQRT